MYWYRCRTLVGSVFPFELLYGVKQRLYASEDSLSVHSLTIEGILLKVLSLKSLRLNRIHKKEFNEGQVDDMKVINYKIGYFVLVARGRVVRSCGKFKLD